MLSVKRRSVVVLVYVQSVAAGNTVTEFVPACLLLVGEVELNETGLYDQALQYLVAEEGQSRMQQAATLTVDRRVEVSHVRLLEHCE